MAFKILRKNCCGLDIHKTWIFACIGITDSNGRTEYKQARFSSFSNSQPKMLAGSEPFPVQDWIFCSWVSIDVQGAKMAN